MSGLEAEVRRYGMSVMAAVAIAVGAGACGGGSGGSEAAQIQGAYTAFLHGLASGNGSEACGALTPEYQKRLVSTTSSLGVKSCDQFVREAGREIPSADRGTVDAISAKVVAIKNDVATVRLQIGSKTRTGSVAVAKVDGRWRLDGIVSA